MSSDLLYHCLAEALDKVSVAPALRHLHDYALGRLGGAPVGQGSPYHPYALELAPVEQEILAARTRFIEIDGGENALLSHVAVEMELHISGALELLEYHIIHAAARLYQGCREYGNGTALLKIASCAEKFLGLVKSRGVETSAESPAARRLDKIVRPCELRDRKSVV